jgi:lipopolysaccharide export system permease protein
MALPLLWRLLLQDFFKNFFLSVTALLFILCTTRLRDLSHVISLGATLEQAASFFLLQVPYLLPIIVPLSALIAGFNQFKNLSSKGQHIALQASAISTRQILTPPLIASLFIGIFTFYIVSEVTTGCQKATSALRQELSSINPLLLLKNRPLLEEKGLFYVALGAENLGIDAKNSLIVMANKEKNLQLLFAETWTQNKGVLKGENVTWLAHDRKKNDEWWVQTSKETYFPLSQIAASQTKNNISQEPVDHLKLIPLLKRVKKGKEEVIFECTRRLSLSFMPITFAFLGACCGLKAGKREKNSAYIVLFTATILTLSIYIASKQVAMSLFSTVFLYLPPPLLHIFAGLSQLKRV